MYQRCTTTTPTALSLVPHPWYDNHCEPQSRHSGGAEGEGGENIRWTPPPLYNCVCVCVCVKSFCCGCITLSLPPRLPSSSTRPVPSCVPASHCPRCCCSRALPGGEGGGGGPVRLSRSLRACVCVRACVCLTSITIYIYIYTSFRMFPFLLGRRKGSSGSGSLPCAFIRVYIETTPRPPCA